MDKIVSSGVRTKGRITTFDIIMCGLFTALITIGAFIKIPVPVVPFTLQLFFTMMAGLILGSKMGAISVSVYMVLGLVGVPIFAEGGGFWYILKPSFGYIIGFIVGTYLTGYIVEHLSELSYMKILFANLAGLLVVYIFGMVYYYVVSNYVINMPIGVWPVILYCFIFAVPGDIALCILGALIGKRLIIAKRRIVDNKL